MTKDLADELERLATKLDDEPDAARRIYRTAALSLWVENNLPAILSALRKPASLTGEGEPVACPDRETVAGEIIRAIEAYENSAIPESWDAAKTAAFNAADRVIAFLSGGGE